MRASSFQVRPIECENLTLHLVYVSPTGDGTHAQVLLRQAEIKRQVQCAMPEHGLVTYDYQYGAKFVAALRALGYKCNANDKWWDLSGIIAIWQHFVTPGENEATPFLSALFAAALAHVPPGWELEPALVNLLTSRTPYRYDETLPPMRLAFVEEETPIDDVLRRLARIERQLQALPYVLALSVDPEFERELRHRRAQVLERAAAKRPRRAPE